MDWKFQTTLKLDICFSLEHYFISVAIFTQVASAPLKSLKIICEEVNLQWSCVVLTCKLTKNLFYTPSFMYFAFILPSHHNYFLPKRLWKCASPISFRKYKRKVVLLVIYLFNYDSSKSAFFIWHLPFSWVQFL